MRPFLELSSTLGGYYQRRFCRFHPRKYASSLGFLRLRHSVLLIQQLSGCNRRNFDSPVGQYLHQMQQSQSAPSIITLIKSYDVCLILTIVTLQAAFSFAIPIFTSTSHLLPWALILLVLSLHLIGAYSFSRSLRVLGVQRMRMIGLYTLVPFGSIFCIIELSKAVNTRMKAIGAARGMKHEEILAIERKALENHW